MTTRYIGCSGFHYKHWRGSFYPEKLPQREWFRYYCSHFQTLELNVTFYRFPRVHTLQAWYNDSPADFRFAVKAPRAITQYKKFIGTNNMLYDFYTAVKEGLQEKAACCLFQMPPNFQYDPAKLERIINSLDPTMNNVLEFRHSSWWNDEVFRSFSEHNISFCGMSHPALPNDLIQTAALLYYRFHGSEQLYSSSYSRETLIDFSKDLAKKHASVKHEFIYFNNDIGTNAIYNAQELKSILSNF